MSRRTCSSCVSASGLVRKYCCTCAASMGLHRTRTAVVRMLGKMSKAVNVRRTVVHRHRPCCRRCRLWPAPSWLQTASTPWSRHTLHAEQTTCIRTQHRAQSTVHATSMTKQGSLGRAPESFFWSGSSRASKTSCCSFTTMPVCRPTVSTRVP